MIFKRREKPTLRSRLRALISPRKGWRRGFRYIGKRVQRLPDTPHRIALGFACGAFASFSPFFTLHIFVAALYAWVVRGNLIAAAFGTIVGNPISFPLIAAACMKTGNWILSRSGAGDYLDKLTFSYAWNHPFQFFESIFTPYLIGGVPPGLLCATALYFLLRPIIARFQERRRKILSSRARAQLIRRTEAENRAKSKKRENDSDDGGESQGKSNFVASNDEPALVEADWSDRKVG